MSNAPLVSLPVFRSPVGLGHAVTILLGAVAATDLLIIGAAFNVRGLMREVGSGGGTYTQDELDLADIFMGGGSLLYGVLLIATASVYIVWFHRARCNAEVFAPDLQRRGAGWAIGAWFIPIVNLFMPRGIAGDVWRASSPDPYGRPVSTALLNFWWGAWIVSLFYDRYATKTYDKAETPGEIADAATLVMTGAAFDIGAAVLAILVVRKVTAMQHAKATGGVVPATL